MKSTNSIFSKEEKQLISELFKANLKAAKQELELGEKISMSRIDMINTLANLLEK